jgi:DNA processing protein
LDQGRDVLAVPGHPFDARASGYMLIRDGAILVPARDVLDHASDPTTIAPRLPFEPVPQPRGLRENNAAACRYSPLSVRPWPKTS